MHHLLLVRELAAQIGELTGPEWGQFFCPNEKRKMKTAEDAGDAEDF